MSIEKAELISVRALHCNDCPLQDRGRPCHTVTSEILSAVLLQDPTVDIPSHESGVRPQAAQEQLSSYTEANRAVAVEAGKLACLSAQQFYNDRATEPVLSVMI